MGTLGSSLTFTRWAVAFALVAALTMCALPLVATIGPESALVLGVVLAPWAAAIGARLTVHGRAQRIRTSTLLANAVGASFMLVVIAVAVLAANAVRVKTCDPFGGLGFMALGPLASVAMSAVAGATIATVVKRPRLAITLAVMLPFAGMASAVYDFVASPGIFAFGHFFGYFPGTFYDRRIDIPDAWLSHRALGALLFAGSWAFIEATRNTRTGFFDGTRIARHPVLASFVIVAATGSLSLARRAHELGHTTSSAHITDKLGLVIESARCRAVVPRELRVSEAHRLAEDCELRVAQLERTLQVRERERITAFFFRSPQEKRVLMGAARVYIAKPWRREVYVQLADYPHEVLPHELAHVVARHAARGPFGVPGRLGGLIPEPTLVEGMAVALEPAARDELTAHQWAKAAYAAKVAPSLASLLGPSFFGTNQALAYTLAGSFLRFVLESRGPDALKRVYAEAHVEKALGKPFAELEREWRRALDEVPLPPRAEGLARQRFERPSIFAQVCPHEVERLSQEVSAALSAGDLERAATKCRDVLAIDPRDTSTRATLASTLAYEGNTGAATHELSTLEGPPAAPAPTLARARTALADAAFQRGDFAAAERTYRAMLEAPQPESELRQLEVRLIGLEAGEPTRRLLGELLIGRSGQSTDPRTAMYLIHELYRLRRDGLAHYLAARQLGAADRHDLAYPLLREALARGLTTRRLRVEALRMRALSAFLVGALDDARTSMQRLADLDDATLAERLDAADFLDRVRFRERELRVH